MHVFHLVIIKIHNRRLCKQLAFALVLNLDTLASGNSSLFLIVFALRALNLISLFVFFSPDFALIGLHIILDFIFKFVPAERSARYHSEARLLG
jgi:hypothetical protein